MTRKKPAPLRGPTFESCGRCSPDGWVLAWRRWGNDGARLVRCACWKIHQQRLSDLAEETQKKI